MNVEMDVIFRMVEVILTTSILALLSWTVRATLKGVDEHKKAHELLKDANLYQIKATLLFMYRRAVENDKISEQELDVFNELHGVYTELGGNGFIEVIAEKMEKIELVADY